MLVGALCYSVSQHIGHEKGVSEGLLGRLVQDPCGLLMLPQKFSLVLLLRQALAKGSGTLECAVVGQLAPVVETAMRRQGGCRCLRVEAPVVV